MALVLGDKAKFFQEDFKELAPMLAFILEDEVDGVVPSVVIFASSGAVVFKNDVPVRDGPETGCLQPFK